MANSAVACGFQILFRIESKMFYSLPKVFVPKVFVPKVFGRFEVLFGLLKKYSIAKRRRPVGSGRNKN